MSARLLRRQFLCGASSGFFAFASRNFQAHALAKAPTGRAKRCLVLWMNGGPSQFETFDPKPGTDTGGELGAIDTAVPGLQVSETLPNIATRADKLSVIRNITSPEGEHVRAQYFLHTGYRFVPAFPRPAMGSVVSHQTQRQPFPNFVSIGERLYGPAFLGSEHTPFAINDPAEAKELLLRIRKRQHRIQLLQSLGAEFDEEHQTEMLERRSANIARIETLVNTPFVDALDVEREPKASAQRYGEGRFSRACITARRLLECGVNFVEIQHDGWDTHANNARAVKRLCGEIDRPWSTLLDDLSASGLLDETLVLWLGEFGRTPNINANRGRDHYPRVTQAVVGGCGLGGRIVGTTNRRGDAIVGDSYSVADLFATVFHTLGIDHEQDFQTAFGSPTPATDNGSLIKELT